MITTIPIEPVSEAHGLLIIAAFNRLFVRKGGQQDGYGWGYGSSYGWGHGGKCPEEWLIDEISKQHAGGQKEKSPRRIE